MKLPPPIIAAQDLAALMTDDNLVLIDARVGADIKSSFEKQHLAGAQFVDLEADMADRKANAADGGRHPLPPIERFTQLLGKLGIGIRTQVVVYDDKNGANAAARFWWMLRAVGHQNVQVLDGGWQAALAAGLPLSTGNENRLGKPAYPADNWQLKTADLQEVERAAANADSLVIDVRDAYRYRGESEPIDLVAGHIPGAINLPFIQNLDENGSFKSKSDLKKQFEPIFDKYAPDQIIVHCGSGVTACHTLLAMAEAGFEIPKMYVGSWSEWSRNDKPIGKS
jgi:thiosulfate/3-mercaptopyruvate sulfurtransferase